MDPATALDFTGRVAIVTGGTKGLGRVIAGTFLDAGAEVVICARNAPETPVASADGARPAVFVEADVRAPVCRSSRGRCHGPSAPRRHEYRRKGGRI